jgi:toxin ParE1/3/4
MRISFGEAARDEAEQAGRWYRTHGSDNASKDFANEVRRIVLMVSQQPELGSSGVHGTRRIPLQRFPFTLIYRIQADAIRVVAVAHQSRRPEYWAGRR